MKIGITTHYYKSLNYGGNLQAYALCKVLKDMGHECEQMCYTDSGTEQDGTTKTSGAGKLRRYISLIKPWLYMQKSKRLAKKYDIVKRRRVAFANFNENMIPHSAEIYTPNTLNKANEIYDAFITGSDQIWNLRGKNDFYFLKFANGRPKISYAASIAKEDLSPEQKLFFNDALSDFKTVSVRESSAVSLLKDTHKNIVQTLDPTLLLSREEWDEVAEEIKPFEKYVFCYFLGVNKKSYKLARKFASKHGLKLVNIPIAGGRLRLDDTKYGDARLFDTSPEQFISLIKNAEYVFTDSFHAVVFANIYQKQYFVFNRNPEGAMSSRITDITTLFDQNERFCAGKERENINYIESLSPIDYSKPSPRFEKMKAFSMEFLKSSLS
ncbi:MAG: polysaccharide pyruvyl transferase family protein [Ruminococcaceae bacterium]|nr:polysaccharide pyruvyl transferase family protein [Oscillospiraceae bacterium]